MSTLQEAAEALKSLQPKRPKKTGTASRWLGRFTGLIPPGTTSTVWLRELRQTWYGKRR